VRANALPHPTRQEWRSPAGTIIHEPRLWLPYIVIRFDGVRLGGFPTWTAAREEMARCEATLPERVQMTRTA
jgi:hypothetical protein